MPWATCRPLEQTGLWGWLALGAGVLWIAAGLALWSLRPWAWVFAMVVAGLALFEAFLYFLEYPGSGLGLGMSILPFIIILYLNSADVKAAFSVEGSRGFTNSLTLAGGNGPEGQRSARGRAAARSTTRSGAARRPHRRQPRSRSWRC